MHMGVVQYDYILTGLATEAYGGGLAHTGLPTQFLIAMGMVTIIMELPPVHVKVMCDNSPTHGNFP